MRLTVRMRCCLLAAGAALDLLIQTASATPSAQFVDRCNSAGKDFSHQEHSWYWQGENDAIALFSGSDESYTQGIQLGFTFAADSTPSLLARPMVWACDLLASIASDRNKFLGSATVFMGQHLFTPGSLSEPNLIVDDRPYAGWLYVGTRLGIVQPLQSDAPARRGWRDLTHTLELQIGITGRRANGEWVQREFHKLINDNDLPKGWDNQIPTEVGLFARYKLQGRYHLAIIGEPGLSLMVDAIPETDLALGNIQTYAGAGGVIRVGRNLGDPPSPVLTPSATESRNRSCGRVIVQIEECYLFIGIRGTASAYNAFLDGTMFHESHSVDRESFFYDLIWGARVRFMKMQFDYTWTRRSKEFSPMPLKAENADGHHDYGALNVRCMDSLDFICPAFIALLLGAVAAQ